MAKFLTFYIVALAVMAGLDAIWLSQSFAAIYKPVLGPLMPPKSNWLPAILFYLIYPIAIYVFAVMPALRDGGWTSALLHGALLGFSAYATYDLTNFATLRGWNWTITLFDIGWGTLLTGAVATLSCLAVQWMSGRTA